MFSKTKTAEAAAAAIAAEASKDIDQKFSIPSPDIHNDHQNDSHDNQQINIDNPFSLVDHDLSTTVTPTTPMPTSTIHQHH